MKTQNDFMEEYVNSRDIFLNIILESENFANGSICESCKNAEGLFRCLTCCGDHAWCCRCVLNAHRWLPFHKLQQWTGKCFHNTSLSNLGYIWHMGHGGQPCPHSPIPQEWEDVDEDVNVQEEDAGIETVKAPVSTTTTLTVVHSTGVFTHNMLWCLCPGSDNQQHSQLLKAGLFPASISRPRTAFTFDVLDHFLIDALECKTSAMSFFQKLRRLTSNAFPDSVPVRCCFVTLFIFIHHPCFCFPGSVSRANESFSPMEGFNESKTVWIWARCGDKAWAW